MTNLLTMRGTYPQEEKDKMSSFHATLVLNESICMGNT